MSREMSSSSRRWPTVGCIGMDCVQSGGEDDGRNGVSGIIISSQCENCAGGELLMHRGMGDVSENGDVAC